VFINDLMSKRKNSLNSWYIGYSQGNIWVRNIGYYDIFLDRAKVKDTYVHTFTVCSVILPLSATESMYRRGFLMLFNPLKPKLV
jgi:hypothetical protein